ncbi:hypothetical protein [Vogesella oryzae]|uniref:hypothetical protein n=1 Tax=Vogesella oryzae TaxID=1735285 RepID=UPI00158338D0|nr:hypothetical protein [Vogesella oryzae]
MHYETVEPNHFLTLRKTPFPHVLIEQKLLAMAGGGQQGMDFRRKALTAAGWPHDGLTPFAKYPDKAAAAFNRIARALAGDPDCEQLLAALAAGDA